jgi:predicted lipid-binding transport protein (Tim44 family)
MKHLILTLAVAVFGLGFAVPEAEAKRLGGGSSIGMKRQAAPQQAPNAPSATQQAPRADAAAAPAQQPRRSWMGPLAGLAAGLGLAALFSHLGLGDEVASLLLIGLLAFAAFMLFRMLTRRGQAPQQGAGLQYAGAARAGGQAAPRPMMPPGAGVAPPQPAVPAGFDAEGFARHAKLNFIRLQAANDSGNLDDLREFTTPEVFAELKMQLAERGNAEQRTDVVELNAEVVEVAEEAGRYVVSVRFNGLLREEAGGPPSHFDEIWHLTKPVAGGSGWVVAGIQQVG